MESIQKSRQSIGWIVQILSNLKFVFSIRACKSCACSKKQEFHSNNNFMDEIYLKFEAENE